MPKMPKLKLIGEVSCYKCNELIQIDENMGILNLIGKRCSHCDTLNVIKVIINENANKNF